MYQFVFVSVTLEDSLFHGPHEYDERPSDMAFGFSGKCEGMHIGLYWASCLIAFKIMSG